MGDETLIEERRWLHNQLNGAVAFAVLTIVIVTLRCIVKVLVDWKRRTVTRLLIWEDSLVLASLFAFLALCACAIGC